MSKLSLKCTWWQGMIVLWQKSGEEDITTCTIKCIENIAEGSENQRLPSSINVLYL